MLEESTPYLLGNFIYFLSLFFSMKNDFSGGSDGKASAYNERDPGSISGSGRSSGEGNGNPVLLPGESHGWRSLVGYSTWGRKESDTTERLHFLSLFQWKSYDKYNMQTNSERGSDVLRKMFGLLHLKWITNKGLLYSTWNSVQCCVAASMKGEFEGEWIHVYV